MTREDKLIKKMELGDHGAMDELIEMYYPEILRYCLWHAPDRDQAQDAAQETFLKAIRYFDRYVHKGKWKPFLYKIAANTCVDLHRKKWSSELSLEELSGDAAARGDPFDDCISDLNLLQLLKNLQKESRELVLLRFAQDLTLSEIAQVTGLPLRTVQSRLRSALKRIKKEWKEEY